ncbi:hypothetical protein Mal4_10900 [Maioricimonas rarisocia]|uniref:Uncharacterized protein n=1 Tax=Maioricimonas rarisocia TaxID=2528026 RepID=A0A517Z2S2_9PLAN|nr:hypothetical protein [Maioricimonas rarisocia]QDU36792.1 hypothetical protein Mal4_10900 [Maioricimonas rarisocia]
MASARYRKLLTNLPSMAAVVNSFESADVQLAVYQELIQALDEVIPAAGDSAVPLNGAAPTSSTSTPDDGEVTHDLVEGDSIHSMAVEE